MKHFTSLFFCLAIAIGATAQQTIPNPSFEEWSEEGGIFSSYLDPVGWNTLNSSTSILGIFTSARAGDPEFVFSGDYALKLETSYISIVDRLVPALCTTGEINTDTEEVEGGIPMEYRPYAIAGWFQYYPADVDTGQVLATLTRWNDLDGQTDTIGTAAFYATEMVDTYTQFQGVIDYWSELYPDTMQILLSSSKLAPKEGSIMYLDDFMLEYEPTGILSHAENDITLFPNPASSHLYFEAPGAAEVKFFSVDGRFVQATSISLGQQKISVSHLNNGQYLAVFYGEQGQRTGQERVMILR